MVVMWGEGKWFSIDEKKWIFPERVYVIATSMKGTKGAAGTEIGRLCLANGSKRGKMKAPAPSPLRPFFPSFLSRPYTKRIQTSRFYSVPQTFGSLPSFFFKNIYIYIYLHFKLAVHFFSSSFFFKFIYFLSIRVMEAKVVRKRGPTDSAAREAAQRSARRPSSRTSCVR